MKGKVHIIYALTIAEISWEILDAPRKKPRIPCYSKDSDNVKSNVYSIFQYKPYLHPNWTILFQIDVFSVHIRTVLLNSVYMYSGFRFSNFSQYFAV